MEQTQTINQSGDVAILVLSTDRHVNCSDIPTTQADPALVSDNAGYLRSPLVGSVPQISRVPIVEVLCQCEKGLQDRFPVTATAISSIDYAHAPEEQLLAAAKASDERAFAELTSRSTNSLRNRVFRIVRNREDTEDVLQETLLRAYLHLNDFRGNCRFSTWLTRIAINSALMLLRKKNSRSELFHNQWGNEEQKREVWEFPDPSPNPEEAYRKRQALELVSLSTSRLPPRQRRVFELRHRHEYSLQECAAAIGITVPSAKSRLLRGRLNIRSILKTRRVCPTDLYC